jgi:cyclopropane-fatty-acyl-phospholipid synthase
MTQAASWAAAAAAEILREVFGKMENGFTFRLWDGTEVRVGLNVNPFCVGINSPAVLRRILAHPTPDVFAEAYINQEIDLEGDLFACMHVANEIEMLEIPFWRRLFLGYRAWRLSA